MDGDSSAASRQSGRVQSEGPRTEVGKKIVKPWAVTGLYGRKFTQRERDTIVHINTGQSFYNCGHMSISNTKSN